MSNIYVIEGLPGSGKTTFSKKLEEHLLSIGIKVKRFSEGDLHPIDLAWCSIMDKDTFDYYCNHYCEIKDDIIKHTKIVKDDYITAYTQIELKESYKDFYDVFGEYEIFKTNSLDTFLNKHLEIYSQFIIDLDQDMTYIFECVFLQNHINELILKYNASLEQILDYYNKLIEALYPQRIKIIYINQVNVKSTLDHIINERKTNNPLLYKDWIDNVLEYVQEQPFSEELNYLGYDGFLRFLKDRKQLELKLLNELNIKSIIIDLEDNYDLVFESIKNVVKNK